MRFTDQRMTSLFIAQFEPELRHPGNVSNNPSPFCNKVKAASLTEHKLNCAKLNLLQNINLKIQGFFLRNSKVSFSSSLFLTKNKNYFANVK